MIDKKKIVSILKILINSLFSGIVGFFAVVLLYFLVTRNSKVPDEYGALYFGAMLCAMAFGCFVTVVTFLCSIVTHYRKFRRVR